MADLSFDSFKNIALKHEYVVLTNHSNEMASFGAFENYFAFSNEYSTAHHLPIGDELKFGFFTFESFHKNFRIASQDMPKVKFPGTFFINTKYFLSYNQFLNKKLEDFQSQKIEMKPEISKEEYVAIIEKIKSHIQQGDIYETNFCFQFQGVCDIDPYELYNQLNLSSPSPFSCFVKHKNCYLICASPERFLKNQSGMLISQPIKGTSKRGLNPTDDKNLAEILFKSEKERSENIMIVDLVRNDLSRVCIPGTVKVAELCGIYSYRHVHQMISTVTGQKDENYSWIDVIEALYPMGSMTGAPKHKAIELISRYEKTQRGMFSGAVGYVKPNGDFDFNVVIRSILYDDESKKISVNVGSAITINSDPELEYDECFLKAKAMLNVLGA
ncbi:MAG: anthranilate synthase component I family protein [Cytophagales bacterium]